MRRYRGMSRALWCVTKGVASAPAGHRLHHGGLDFQKVAGQQKVADLLDDSAAAVKDLAHLLVHHQVQIAPAVAFFGILEPVKLFGQRGAPTWPPAPDRGPSGSIHRCGFETDRLECRRNRRCPPAGTGRKPPLPHGPCECKPGSVRCDPAVARRRPCQSG